MELYEYTAHELSDKLKSKEVKVTEITKSYLDRIKTEDEKIKAYITVCEESALKKSEEIQKMYDAGNAISDFAGVPIAIKDNLCTKGIKTTCASKMLENFVSPYDATVVEKLNEQNLIMLGKLNMDEFAFGRFNRTFSIF